MAATDGVGRVFAFARRTDHDRGLITRSPYANYPARLSSSASYIYGTCAIPSAKGVILLLPAVAYLRNSAPESQEAPPTSEIRVTIIGATGLLKR